MRLTIIGAGAVGGSLGAFLVQAGHQVVLVDRVEEHVRAINAAGLRLEGPQPLHVRVPARLPEEVHAPLGAVVLAVKSHDTQPALAPIAPHLAADEYVVSLQNGLEEPKIARLVGLERTVGAFITTGAHYAGPGRIFVGGSGTIRIGELDGRTTPRVEALRDAFSAYQPTAVTDNVLGYLWGKLALGCIYFASALVDADFLDLTARPEYLPLLTDVGAEAVTVADARGVRLEPFDGFDPSALRFRGRDPAAVARAWEGERAFWRTLEVRRTGIWRDLAIRRRKTEADGQLGVLIQQAEEVGVDVPRNRAVYRLVREIESGDAQFVVLVREIERGDAQFVVLPSIGITQDPKELASKPGIKMVDTPALRVTVISMNTQKGPLQDVRLRKALQDAFDYQGMLQIYQGYAEVPNSPLPKGFMAAYDPSLPLFKQDLAEAKRLLAEAGYGNGGLTLSFVYTETEAQARLVGLLMQSTLQPLGVTLDLQGKPFATLAAQIADRNTAPDIQATLTMTPCTADPGELLATLYAGNNVGQSYNYSWYANPEVDQMLAEADRTFDDSQRMQIYRQIAQKLIDDAPSIWAAYPKLIEVMRDEVQNYVYSPLDYSGVFSLYPVGLKK